MYQTDIKAIEHDGGITKTRPNIPKEETSPTEGKINEINKKLGELTEILNSVLRSDNEELREGSIPESETKLLTSLVIIEEKIAYLLNNIIL